jgi:hypothetical protein
LQIFKNFTTNFTKKKRLQINALNPDPHLKIRALIRIQDSQNTAQKKKKETVFEKPR